MNILLNFFYWQSQSWTSFRGNFYAFDGFLSLQNGNIFSGLLKFQMFFFGMPDIPDIIFGKQ